MRLCFVFIFLFELQILGLSNFNQGKKEQTVVATLVPCLCLCMGTDITGSNHSKQTTNSIYCQGCEKKSLTDWWGESREGLQPLWRATNPYLLKIKNAFTSLYPDYGEGYTNLCRR